MQRFLTIKNYFRAAVIMSIFAALVVYLPGSFQRQPEIYLGIPVSDVSVQYEVFGNSNFQLQQLHGVKIVNPDTGKFTYYFEYIANKQDTLRRIAALPFLKDNRPSSFVCELMNSAVNPLDDSMFTPEARNATSFFWNVQPEDFIFYECYKSPVKHTLLLSKTSDRILHKVEFI